MKRSRKVVLCNDDYNKGTKKTFVNDNNQSNKRHFNDNNNNNNNQTNKRVHLLTHSIDTTPKLSDIFNSHLSSHTQTNKNKQCSKDHYSQNNNHHTNNNIHKNQNRNNNNNNNNNNNSYGVKTQNLSRDGNKMLSLNEAKLSKTSKSLSEYNMPTTKVTDSISESKVDNMDICLTEQKSTIPSRTSMNDTEKCKAIWLEAISASTSLSQPLPKREKKIR
jgi:hypothetical protein